MYTGEHVLLATRWSGALELGPAGFSWSWRAGPAQQSLLAAYLPLPRVFPFPFSTPNHLLHGADPRSRSQPLMRIDGKPYNPNARGGGRNAPSIIRDGGQRAQSTPARTNTGPSAAASSTSIETIRLFLASRYNAQDKLLNMENMASDTILNSAGVLAPGQVGAARDISPVIWKLASQMFPDVHISQSWDGAQEANLARNTNAGAFSLPRQQQPHLDPPPLSLSPHHRPSQPRERLSRIKSSRSTTRS